MWDSVADAGRRAIKMRYQLLPHLYTAFHQANKQGTPVARPLWFDNPQDPATHAVDDQWLFGDVLVTPILDQVSTALALATCTGKVVRTCAARQPRHTNTKNCTNFSKFLLSQSNQHRCLSSELHLLSLKPFPCTFPQLLTACADIHQTAACQLSVDLQAKRVAAVPDSSGCITTTTNAADGENADPNREADWLAAAMR